MGYESADDEFNLYGVIASDEVDDDNYNESTEAMTFDPTEELLDEAI